MRRTAAELRAGKLPRDEETASFDARCVAETDKAILVDVDGEEHWIPKSQVHESSRVCEKDDEGVLVVTKWIARLRGLVR